MMQEDGHERHRPKASTIHGWLAKWRGTFTGNEQVRQQGRREMKEAAALRTYRRQRGSSGKPSGGGFLIFGVGKGSASKHNSAPKRHTSTHTAARGHSQRQVKGHSVHRPSQSRRPNHRRGDSRHTSPRPIERGKGGASGSGPGVSRRGTGGSQAQRVRPQVSTSKQVTVRRPSGRR